MEMVILMGLQAAGKSTFRRARFDTHVVVSKDNFRNNRRPARRQEQLLREALRGGRRVVVDNTNARRADREQLILLAREFSVPALGFFLRSTLEESLQRNALREGRARVPDIGVLATTRTFVPPAWSEGFQELYEVTSHFDGTFTVLPFPREP